MIMKKIKITFAMIAITSLMFAASSAMTPAHAAPVIGDILASYNIQSGLGLSQTSVGMAFDGTNLYTTIVFSPFIYTIDPTNGQVTGQFNPGIPELPNAMAYDATQNGLWIATQGPTGGGVTSCVGGTGMPIYFYDFDDSSTTLVFSMPIALITQLLETLTSAFASLMDLLLMQLIPLMEEVQSCTTLMT